MPTLNSTGCADTGAILNNGKSRVARPSNQRNRCNARIVYTEGRDRSIQRAREKNEAASLVRGRLNLLDDLVGLRPKPEARNGVEVGAGDADRPGLLGMPRRVQHARSVSA